MNHATLLDRLVQAHLFQAETGGDTTNTDGTLEGVTRNNVNPPTDAPAATETPAGEKSTFVPPGQKDVFDVAPSVTTQVATEAPVIPAEQETGTGMDWVWIVVAVAVAAVLAAVAVLLLRRKPGGKKAANEPADDIPAHATMPTTLDEGETATVQMSHPVLKVGRAQHIGRRSDQQDCFGFSSLEEAPLKGLLAVVADGMGGMSDGAAISNMAVQTILNNFRMLPVEQNPPLQMMGLAGAAHKAICSMPSAGQGGSTLLMAYVYDEWLFTLSIGDSRMYLMRDHTLMQLNREHTYGVELDERAALGEISLEQALNDPQRKALTSYLGIDDLQKIDRTLRPFPLRRGDRVALMSDGVFGTISDAEIQVLLELPPQEAAQQIQEAVLLKNQPRQDNLTVLIVAYE